MAKIEIETDANVPEAFDYVDLRVPIERPVNAKLRAIAKATCRSKTGWVRHLILTAVAEHDAAKANANANESL